ncbi:hypothetical protein [Enterocloster asparagiformis]|uniref:Uncharacterized protein n=1 Tax=[Clostridium] asparagiforme DSM 15981 TaxID=518636 RepID=C0DA73_9FIRM|nr:hypothetical protein [Enterocloster asparagiformis]EEG51779.1 hypothetical protein CLOSTASPAR_06176 [[Clostridium] asparagiforme DSM 15981]UWO77376.1 hypothetical protein NQ535_03575 [[Clostridium] asparagiforme DSM 15981]
MMSKKEKILTTPDMIPKNKPELSNTDIETISSKVYKKQFKHSIPYKKYVKPMLDCEKSRKQSEFSVWWWGKGLLIINTILAFIAAITGVIAILLQLNLI